MAKHYFILGEKADSYNNAAAGLSLGKKDIGFVESEKLPYVADAQKGKHIVEISENNVRTLLEQGYSFYGSITPSESKKEEAPLDSQPPVPKGGELGPDANTNPNGDGEGNPGSVKAGEGGNSNQDDDDEDEPETKTEYIDWLKENAELNDKEKKKLTSASIDELKALYEKYKK